MYDVWAADPKHRSGDFVVRVLEWDENVESKGRREDAIQGHAPTKLVQSWCRTNGLTMSARFELSHYGVEWANSFDRVWCAKMQHFYNIAVLSSGHKAKHVFSVEEKSRWTEPVEFTKTAHLASKFSKQATRRVAQIRELFS